jgi:hypothetical protein
MFCAQGFELYEEFQAAERMRKAVLERRAAAENGVSPKEVQAAKQQYVERFANWLSHKAFCQDCKPEAQSRGQQPYSTAPGR